MTAHLLVLPGMDGTGRLLQPLVEAIGARARCTICAYPTHTALDYDQLTKLVEQSIPRNEPWVILAESFSGPIAVKIAAANPQGLKGVILCASFVKNPLPLLAPWVKVAVWLGMLQIVPQRWILRRLMLGPHAPEALVEMSQQAIRIVAPPVMAHRVRQALSVDATELFRAIALPVAYIAGTADQLFPARLARELQSLKPELKIVSVDAPHFILLTEPHAAASAVLTVVAQFESA